MVIEDDDESVHGKRSNSFQKMSALGDSIMKVLGDFEIWRYGDLRLT